MEGCPLADEWIRKLRYLYTMEYYSTIKKNAFESVLMRWMELEPIIQSEVSQKEKHQYSILTHTWTVNFQMFKLVLEKAEEPEIKLPIHWIIEKAREFQKNIYFCFIDYAKAFDCVDHNKLWKILREMGIPDHLFCLLRNLYAGQEATVTTGHGTTDLFQVGKGVYQGCIL